MDFSVYTNEELAELQQQVAQEMNARDMRKAYKAQNVMLDAIEEWLSQGGHFIVDAVDVYNEITDMVQLSTSNTNPREITLML